MKLLPRWHVITWLRRVQGRNNEGLVAALITVICLIVGLVDYKFWALGTLFDILRNSFELLLFSLGFLTVLIAGEIDVSFDAIGIFVGYLVTLLATKTALLSNIPGAFAFAILLGILLGFINALTVAFLRLPVLIVTLGTRGIFVGFLLTVIGTNYIYTLPGELGQFGHLYLLVVHGVNGRIYGLHLLTIPTLLLCVAISWCLRNTVLGRSLYAVGGDAEAAKRIGISPDLIKGVALCAAGALAGMAGLVHVTLIGYGNPFDLVGNETDVIASVILGGAAITGGRGSILGTVLGVLLVSLIKYSLILLGISSFWQQSVVGLLLLIGISAQLFTHRPFTPMSEGES